MTATTPRVRFLDLAADQAPLRAELDAVWDDVVSHAAYVGGAYTTRFEKAWADYCGVNHAVGVANGTDSIELILRALGIGVGDEVIIPANTFIATVEATVACGATPILVDVDPETLLMTAEQVTPALTARTAAIIPVHLYGQMCPMTEINDLAVANGLAVVEDAAQAHGALWEGKPAGSFGTAASFSFYPGKNLGAFGDAGAVVTNDGELAAKVRSLANHGRPDGEHVAHALMGRNSRLDGLQAGVLLAKLAHLDRWNDERRAARDRYVENLAGLDAMPVVEHGSARSVWHLNVVRVPQRDKVVVDMEAQGIEVRVHYPTPCHWHPSATHRPVLPIVEEAAQQVLSLPIHPTISPTDIDLTCEALDSVLSALGRSSVR